MNKQLQWKFLAVAAVIALSVYGIMRYGIQLGLDLKGGTSFLLKMDVSDIDSVGRGQAVQQAIEIIHRRIDKFGVTEPIIQRVGDDRILVQVTGFYNAPVPELDVKRVRVLEVLDLHGWNRRSKKAL